MKRSEVIRSVGPSVVAFGSRIAKGSSDSPPPFPPIIGTGFIVDSRGLAVTNRHVVEAMETIPKEARFVMIFPRPEVIGDRVFVGLLTRQINRAFILDALDVPDPLYGEVNPDFAFVEVDLQGLSSLNLIANGNLIEVGSEVVTMGFPMGEVYLSPYSKNFVSQISPFARHGIISSVLPCECPNPHGFSIDVLSEGGASGSPIFLAESGTVIGILHAGFNNAPVTYGVPMWILKQGLDQLNWAPQPDKKTLQEIVEAKRSQGPKSLEWTTIARDPARGRPTT